MPFENPGTIRLVVAVFGLVAAFPAAGHDTGAPAGQLCPPGSYVIGFDVERNIICSGVCGNGIVDAGEVCDDGNRESGDGCAMDCRGESAVTAATTTATETVAPAPPAAAPLVDPAGEVPVIADVEPATVVYGKRELSVTIKGAGFTADSRVMFEGQSLSPSVSPDGKELRVTLPTADLAIGRYPIRVSNGPGREALMKSALIVY